MCTPLQFIAIIISFFSFIELCYITGLTDKEWQKKSENIEIAMLVDLIVINVNGIIIISQTHQKSMFGSKRFAAVNFRNKKQYVVFSQQLLYL